MINTVNIIGAGNVATALAVVLSKKIRVKAVWSRKPKTAIELSSRINSEVCLSLTDLPNADLNIIAVADDVIKDTVKKLDMNIPVVHTSGSVPKSVLKDFRKYGVFYPLQTFSKDRMVEMSEVPFFIETNDTELERELFDLTKEVLNTTPYKLNSDKRKALHLAAVISNNFTNHLLLESKKILTQQEIPFDVLKALMFETVGKAFDLGPENAQTGPANRGDKKIIEDQLKLLKEQEMNQLYKLFTRAIENNKA
ncbi:MAG: Rossmann-like and DUF2520 domain-containing protein [Crocinitomicaceae bacterium]